jgi:hypothetical protein
MSALELAYRILKLHHYDDWSIKIIQSGGALCHHSIKEIWIDERSKDDIFLLLHEIAHIKYPNHDRKWADRFTCLCQRHMGWAIAMGIWADEATLAMPLDVPRMNRLKHEWCQSLIEWPYWNVSPAYNIDESDTTLEAANSQGFLDCSTGKECLQVDEVTR